MDKYCRSKKLEKIEKRIEKKNVKLYENRNKGLEKVEQREGVLREESYRWQQKRNGERPRMRSSGSRQGCTQGRNGKGWIGGCTWGIVMEL